MKNSDIEKNLLQIIDLSPEPLYVCAGDDLRVVYANEATLRVWGKDESIIGKPFIEALPEVIDQPFPKLLRSVYTTGVPYHTENDRADLPVNGVLQPYYFKFSYQPLRNEYGNIWGVLCIATDVTELVKARQLAEESEHRFRIMAESTDILVGVADESSSAIYFNRAWMDFTGRSMDQLVQLGWLDLLHPEDKDRFLAIYMTAFEKKVAFTGEFRLLRKDGEYRWMLAKGPPRFDGDGTFLGYISSAIDISEQKQDEERKNNFIGMVSHELKTPLTAMKAYVQMLMAKAKKQGDSFTEAALEQTNKQVVKMTTLINGFLNVSRLESGKLLLNITQFDLPDLVKEIIHETEMVYSNHPVTLAPSVPIQIIGDRDKIGSVISNLLSNAIKYSPVGKKIEIRCEVVEDRVQVSVKDEGIGIKKEDQKRLFDRYFRVDENQSTPVSGFGIGLYLTAEIIYRHSGNIWVESEVGKGSTFFFNLPL